MTEITNYTNAMFEDIKHIDEYGNEFWYARELMLTLGYERWENFYKAISRAKVSCGTINIEPSNQFREITKLIESGKGAKRPIKDYELTRYACYLIAQNGDPRKEVIALAQTYFAVQTRRQELQDNFNQLTEDQRRLAIRGELAEHNKSLVEAAQQAGVETPREFAVFQNRGYQGLYGGLGQSDIHKRKGLNKNQKILDHMGSTELAANLFRATQTDEKLRRENIQGKEAANETHFEVGSKVRQTIKELGGTMPEDLPTPEKSIQTLRREEKQRIETSSSNQLQVSLFDTNDK